MHKEYKLRYEYCPKKEAVLNYAQSQLNYIRFNILIGGLLFPLSSLNYIRMFLNLA